MIHLTLIASGGLSGLLIAGVAEAQTLRGTVIAQIGSTPILGATITARRSGVAAVTDRAGRFTIALSRSPDTLTIAAIGWVPDTVPVPANLDVPLVVPLARAPVIVSDLIVTGARTPSLDLAEHGRWRMPIEAARTVPPAVETDVYRALALVPAVAFTSPLSARPMIRGYDAQEVTTRIDGFEALNLFHLGRVFASFPADATAEIAVSAPPYTGTLGGSIAGIIDVTGRTGRTDGFHAGGGLSFGSISAYAGGGSRRARYFVAGRLFHLKSLDLIPGIDVPYHFEDLYGGIALGSPERPRARISVFATQDRAGERNDDFLNWDNLLVGGRWRVTETARTDLELSLSGARFRERGDNVPSLHQVAADVANRFTRLAVTADLTTSLDRTRLAAGLSLGWRRIANRIAESEPDQASVPRFPTTDLLVSRPEIGAYTEITRRVGPVTLASSLRLDAAGSAGRLAPRLHGRWAIAPRLELSSGIGRTTRLYHLIGDARSEPDFEFLDFWLNAGNGLPVARVDHVTADLNVDLGRVVARIAGYGSRGSGIGELRPEHDQERGDFFRFGASRTRGLELQLAIRGEDQSPQSLSITYVYAGSERNWGEGWVAWAQDRRHQARVFGQLEYRRLTLFAMGEAATGMPITPVAYVFTRGIPGIETRRPADPSDDQHRPIYGRENVASTSGTFRVDAGATLRFGGPNQSRFVVGVSVINLFHGPVAPFGPETAAGRYAADLAGRPLPYRRLFDLPAVPTLMLRAEL